MRGRGHVDVVPSPGVADFGSVAVTAHADRVISFTNTGSASLRFNAVSVNDDWSFPTFAGCFATTLPPGGTCTQTARFRPSSEGAHSGVLTLGWHDAADPSRTGSTQVTLVGVATPELTASPVPLAFGEVPVGERVERTVTVTNNGSRTVRFNFVGVDDDWTFASFAGCFGTDLAPGQSCTQTPRFGPDDDGPHAGVLRLGWHDTVTTSRTGVVSVPMTGDGV
jgi:hypothetical protein